MPSTLSTEPGKKVIVTRTRPSILVADDDPSVCRIIHRMVSPANYEVHFSQTIAGAIQATGERDFDLYLLDYKLPDGSGLDVAAAIRAKGLQTPIIMITGYQRELGATAQNLGIFVIIEKPFSTETICTAVRKALGLTDSVNAENDLSAIETRSTIQAMPEVILSAKKRHLKTALIVGSLLLLCLCSAGIYLLMNLH
jgi:DNA-binding NtrC family response regulator